MSLPLRIQLLLASAVAALLVGGIFLGMLSAIDGLRSSADRARHSEEVIADANALEKSVLDVETGSRGFMITHDHGFLEPWTHGRAAIPGQIARLQQQVSDTASQEGRAHALGQQISSYVHDYSVPLVALARKDSVVAGETVGLGGGKRRVDRIRSGFDTFRAAETSIAASRRSHADAQARQAIAIGIGGLLAALAVVFLFAAYLSRTVAEPVRRLAGATRRVRDGDLAARVPPGGAGEIRELVDGFNAMGAALGENRDELEGQNAELEAQQAELEAQQSELEDALAELGHEQERTAAAYSFGRRLMAEVEVDAVLSATVDAICDFGGADVATLYALAALDDETLTLAATRALDPAGLPAELGSGGVAARAVAEQRPLTVAYGSTALALVAFGTRVAVAHELHVPIVSAGRTLGLLTMGRAADRPFSPEQVEGAEHLAAQAGIALAQALGFAAAREHAVINAAILNATTDGITLVGPSGEFVFANEAARTIGQAHRTSLDTNFHEVTRGIAELTANPAAYRAAAAARAEHPDRELVAEHELVESGRSFRTYTAPVLTDDGSQLGQIVVVHETTAEREGERLKSELLATVSHELRTPLTGVLGFAELLLRQDVDVDTRRQYLSTIHREARRLTALINDFLDLQRIEEGRFELALDSVDLSAMLERSVALAAGQSERHELALTLPPEPAIVLGEGSRIEQVLANLLSNAIKYSPAGGTVTIEVAGRDGFTRVAITDPGLGIPAAQQAKIFEKFFRVDSSSTREIGGTGLGLALSREIVEAHGGSIGFESVEGRGSTFWFELPTGRRQGKGAGRSHVLVVEDDPAAAALMAEYLSLDGFRVEIAATGERALQLAHADPPSLVCLDMALPGDVDGWQVLTELRASAATAEVPVVICTANNGRNRAATLGASDFLTKPFSAELLRTAVGRLIEDPHGSVLVVDDEPAIRRLVIETLGGHGLEFREAADGEQALAAIGEERPSAVVLDLMLPKLDGFTVLERLQDDPATRTIPVVVLTGSELSADERRRLSRAAVALLDKCEYSGRELRGLVERALRG